MEFASQTFEHDIAEMVKGGATTLDAVLRWCADRDIEIEVGAELIAQNPLLKSRLQMECETLKLVKSKLSI